MKNVSVKKIFSLSAILLSVGLVTACSEAQYAAHVAKQIPISDDVKRENVGHYKVGRPYKIAGKRYYPKERFRYSETGVASWYGPNFHGKPTANGEIYDKFELTAAHRTLQLPSIIKVTNLTNGRSLIMRVNDRGPFAHERVLDVSERGAELLGFKKQGTTRVRIDVLENESREVASIARSGGDTRGYEVALNRNKTHITPPSRPTQYASNTQPQNMSKQRLASASIERQSLNQLEPAAQYHPAPATVRSKPKFEPITQMQLGTETPQPKPSHEAMKIAGINSQRHIAPSPLAKPSDFYVQVGSFQNEQNALNLSRKLAPHGDSNVYFSKINDTPTFRVKLGPYGSNEEARQALSSLQAAGNSGVIVTK